MMELTRWSKKDDPFYEIRPMLSQETMQEWLSLAERCEWLAFGAPSPVGLVPPRHIDLPRLVYVGREDMGAYSLFAYARELYSVRKRLESRLTGAPLQPRPTEVEGQLEKLALMVPNGVLRLGREGGYTVFEQVGLMATSHLAQKGT